MSLAALTELIAVETSSARVVNEHERRLGGWVLLSPEERGMTLSPKLEEKILLLVSAHLLTWIGMDEA